MSETWEVPGAKNGPRRRSGKRPGIGWDESWEEATGFFQAEGSMVGGMVAKGRGQFLGM